MTIDAPPFVQSLPAWPLLAQLHCGGSLPALLNAATADQPKAGFNRASHSRSDIYSRSSLTHEAKWKKVDKGGKLSYWHMACI